MTWYERETNTLIIRPVVPLREETRYAVVLTERPWVKTASCSIAVDVRTSHTAN